MLVYSYSNIKSALIINLLMFLVSSGISYFFPPMILAFFLIYLLMFFLLLIKIEIKEGKLAIRKGFKKSQILVKDIHSLYFRSKRSMFYNAKYTVLVIEHIELGVPPKEMITALLRENPSIKLGVWVQEYQEGKASYGDINVNIPG